MTHRRNIQTSTNSGDFDNNWQRHASNKIETLAAQKRVTNVVIDKHKGRKSRIYGLADSYQVECDRWSFTYNFLLSNHSRKRFIAIPTRRINPITTTGTGKGAGG